MPPMAPDVTICPCACKRDMALCLQPPSEIHPADTPAEPEHKSSATDEIVTQVSDTAALVRMTIVVVLC